MAADYRAQAYIFAGPGRELMVDAIARFLHRNESLHMHEDIGDPCCAYCWLRAGKAVLALVNGSLLRAPVVWWLDDGGESPEPDLYTSEAAAQKAAVDAWKAANPLTEITNLEWLYVDSSNGDPHVDTELNVNHEYTGYVVRARQPKGEQEPRRSAACTAEVSDHTCTCLTDEAGA